MAEGSWKETQNETCQERTREISTDIRGQNPFVRASEIRSEKWCGSFASVRLDLSVQKTGGTLEEAQEVLDKIAPHVEVIVQLLEEHDPSPSTPTDRELLKEVANQLRQWADESKSGGWSTHQVKPQRKLADRIEEHVRKVPSP